MLDVTKQLKRELEGMASYRTRSNFMKDSYKGQKCFVISCGPSLMKHDFKKIKDKLKDEMVICIKQSFDHFKDICDIHVYNCANYKNYDYKGNNSIISESTSFGKILNNKCHLKYHILERRTVESVSVTNEIEKWKLSNLYERPYGPGIMYETVFYLLEHLGVSEIITIGWDNSLKGTDKRYVHFYDIMGGDRTEHVEFNDQKTCVTWESLTEEEQVTVSAMGNWYNWLKEKDITLKIISDTNPAPQFIERIDYNFISGE
jgi:hypothetical protein